MEHHLQTLFMQITHRGGHNMLEQLSRLAGLCNHPLFSPLRL